MGSLQLLERLEKKGVGRQGWVKQGGVAEGWDLNRSWDPSVPSREETSDKDRERDSASPSTGRHWWAQAPPDRNHGWSCTETVQLCTNAHQRRQQPFPPLLTTHKQRGITFVASI